MSKDPDTHYDAMSDDRVSFVKSQTALETTELEALGKTARGESRQSFYNRLNEDSSQTQFLSPSRAASRNTSRNGFHSDSRFHSQPNGFGLRADEPGSPRGPKAYEAEWTPFGSEPNLRDPEGMSAAKIRETNNGLRFRDNRF